MDPHIRSALTVLIGALAGGVVGSLFTVRSAQQCRRPSSRPGRQVLLAMNNRHAAVTQWGLKHIVIEEDCAILDVGCGGGRTINELASRTRGKVCGIDYSEVSVATAREINERAIAEGRVDIQQASVSQLPFPEATFNIVVAVETHYYWPNLLEDVREVMRVIKPGGQFLIIAETYRGRRNDWMYRPTMTRILRAAYLTPDEHRQLLIDAGYVDVQVFTEASKGWISVIGTRA